MNKMLPQNGQQQGLLQPQTLTVNQGVRPVFIHTGLIGTQYLQKYQPAHIVNTSLEIQRLQQLIQCRQFQHGRSIQVGFAYLLQQALFKQRLKCLTQTLRGTLWLIRVLSLRRVRQ